MIEAAEQNVSRGLALAKKRNYLPAQARCLRIMGTVWYYKGNLMQALANFEQSLKIAEKLKDNPLIARCLNNIGAMYQKQSNFPKALDFYLKSMRIYERNKDEIGLGTLYSNIATLYEVQNLHGKSLEFKQKSLKIWEERKDSFRIALVLHNLGMTYSDLKLYDKSLDCYLRSKIISERIDDLQGITACLTAIGQHYEKAEDNPQKALPYFKQSLALYEQMGDSSRIVHSKVNIAMMYSNMKKYDLVYPYALSAYEIAIRIKDIDQMEASSNLLCGTDSVLGNWKSAFHWLYINKVITDSVRNEAKAREFGRLEAQYEHEKQRETEALKEAERRLRANYTYSGIIAIVLISGGFFFYRYRAKAKLNRALQSINEELAFKNQEIAEQRDELTIYNEEIITQRDELSAQADQLATQRDELDHAYHQLQELDEFKEALSGMIVHDLKNPLSTIIGLSEKTILTAKDQITIRQAGKQMLNLTLNILDVQKFEQAQVPLHLKDEALLTIVHDAIEQVSLLIANKNLQINITFEPATGVFCDTELITRVLMNLLTNAIKYTANNGSITIGAEEIPDNQVKISVSDTGQGIPADKLDTVFDKFSQVEAKKSGGARSTGLGLTFCKMTVEAHGGQIGVASEVGVGTTFYFTLAKALNEINPVQPFILPTNTITEINLTAEDQALLQPYLEKLRAFDVYEAGEVLKIIAPIPDTPALAGWKSEMESTVFASNQERYWDLIIKY